MKHSATKGSAKKLKVPKLRGSLVPFMGLAGFLLAALALRPLFLVGPSGDDSASMAFFAMALCVAGGFAVRALRNDKEGIVWNAGSVVAGGWFLGSVYMVLSQPSASELDSLGLVDVCVLLVPVAALAVAQLLRGWFEQQELTVVLDGAIVALTAGALGAIAVDKALLPLAGGDLPAVKVVYPLAALVLLAFTVWMLALTGFSLDRRWALLMGGLGTATVAGSAFVFFSAHGTYEPGGWLDPLWLAAGFALLFAAWSPSQPPLEAILESSRRLTLISIAAVGALAVMVAGAAVPLSAPAILLAAGALAILIVRAGASFKENVRMFAEIRLEAQTDALTGLGNRRKLMEDLKRELRFATSASPRVLVLFDLDGFKRYNDTYGHPAGDVLLARVGGSLGRAIRPYGGGYRLGGDEFCALVKTGASSAKTIISLAAAALSEQGEGFVVAASHGAVMLPHEARNAALALRIADQRMYAHKESRRASATRQTRDILLQVLNERNTDLSNHLADVARLARGVGTKMSLVAEDLDEVVRAAELHDVGKMAIPDEILSKPGPLTAEEWSFIRQHTVIGERILASAPALAPVAKIVRSSHEHWDGSGYPDQLAGEQIPLGARIVAVCDAFDAMISKRPYREAVSIEEALAELRKCAGKQFDPNVVDAFVRYVEEIRPMMRSSASPTAAPAPEPTAPA